MGYRRKARELALQALFFFDMDKSDSKKNLELFCKNNEDELSENIITFFLHITEGVIEYRAEIDSLLNKYSKNWKIFRMPVVDRNVMRIAIFEFLKCSDIPPSVSINEAIEMGKKYGTGDSGAFINGVLDRIRSMESFE